MLGWLICAFKGHDWVMRVGRFRERRCRRCKRLEILMLETRDGGIWEKP